MISVFIATTGSALSRADNINGQWHVSRSLDGIQVNCLAADPLQPGRIYAGSQKNGVLVSEDRGISWQVVGLVGIPVKSLAVSQHAAGTLFAGCKPVSLYVSRDRGASWQELDKMRRTRQWWWFSPAEPPSLEPYVQALTISPTQPEVILAGIELGGVLRSSDEGQTWSKHRRGADRDCHSLTFHNRDGFWVYQGGGGGSAISQDGGLTWRKPKTGLGSKYGWMVASDPERPEVWYLSASDFPSLLRGEFTPPAHHDGQARGHIYRSVGGAAWEQLGGGLPEPLDYMAYALITDSQAPGHLYAGLANGDVWQSKDYGDTWMQLPFNLGGIQRQMIRLG